MTSSNIRRFGRDVSHSIAARRLQGLGALAVLLAMLGPRHSTQPAAQTLSTTADVPPATIMNWAAIGAALEKFVRTKSIVGGVTRRVAKGDVIVMPPGTPHWFSAVDGAITYLEARIPVATR